MTSSTTTLLGTTAALLLLGTAHADVINVPGDAPTIQVAINIAAEGDEIVVAPGTYFETVDLLGKAVTLRSSGGPEVTTIDAFGQFDSVVHAISGEGPDTVIQGLTLTGGNADGAAPDDRGGGLYINASSPTVVDCTFVENSAAGAGGGVYCNAGSPSFTDCRFVGNSAAHGGGAYHNNSDVALSGCEFDQNEATAGEGGAIRIVTGGYDLTDCAFTDNSATTFGGALWLRHATAGAMIVRCRFMDNFCGDGGDAGRGGAVYSGNNSITTLDNCLLVDNAVDAYGGALYSAFPMTVRNCSITGSSAGLGSNSVLAGNIATALVNCIVWGNTGDMPVNPNAQVSYSNIEGGFDGEGNIDANPLFADAAARDLRLQAGSPCIDAGDTTALNGAYPVDLVDAPRAINDPDAADTGKVFLNLAVDMGAYELQVDPLPPTCPGDVNGDGLVDVSDLVEVILNWGICP